MDLAWRSYTDTDSCRENRKRGTFICKLIPKEITGFLKISFILYYLAILIVVISWTSEIVFEKSLSEILIPWLNCPAILRANTSLEVIKAIGISSAFIMLVINAVDKRVLGLRYGEIIQRHFPYYWVCSIIHVVFTLGGIASGTAGASESTLLSLFIVIFGLFIQWQVMLKLILCKQDREKLADSVWEEQIENQATAQKTYSVLQQLASEIEQCSGHVPALLLNRFADALIYFSQKGTLNIRVTQIADVWATVLRGRSETNKDILVGKIFSTCINYDRINLSARRNALITICGGLLVYQIKREVAGNASQDIETKLAAIAGKIGCMIYQIPEIVSPEAIELKDHIHRCLCTLFTVIAWVAFYRGGIRLSDDILCLNSFATKKECKMCAFETVRAIFPVVDDCNINKLNELVEKAFIFTINASAGK